MAKGRIPTVIVENKSAAIYVVVGLAAVGVLYYFYKKGQAAASTTIQALPYDTNASGNTANTTTDQSTLQSYADQVRQDVTGWNFLGGGHDITLYKSILVLSNTDLTELYNIYNTKYQSLDHMTFTARLKDESSGTDVLSPEWTTVSSTLLSKLASINLP